MPPDDRNPPFQALVEDGYKAVGTISLDYDTNKWEAFCPIGRPVGVAPDRREAQKIVESHISELRK